MGTLYLNMYKLQIKQEFPTKNLSKIDRFEDTENILEFQLDKDHQKKVHHSFRSIMPMLPKPEKKIYLISEEKASKDPQQVEDQIR